MPSEREILCHLLALAAPICRCGDLATMRIVGRARGGTFARDIPVCDVHREEITSEELRSYTHKRRLVVTEYPYAPLVRALPRGTINGNSLFRDDAKATVADAIHRFLGTGD